MFNKILIGLLFAIPALNVFAAIASLATLSLD
jgi:hypothetical protein